jgi:amino acid adenylation domain-containing protein
MDEINEEFAATGLEIAVTGMSGRFPGAGGIAPFWENLKNGVESITFFSKEELLEAGEDPDDLENPNYVRARGILDHGKYFDALFFGYTPAEATIMDPQVRHLLECGWEALEDAGCDPGSYDGSIGVYLGSADNLDWRLRVLIAGQTGKISDGDISSAMLANKDFSSSRLSYQLNLTGPSETIYSACSTSLTAIHRACRQLLGGECDIAIAGGACLTIPQERGYLYKEGMLQSPDGHCRAFDKQAAGTVFGSGVGIVVLKRLDDAVTDGNHIYAVIKGSAVNNDGRRKVGFSAPSVEGLTEVIRSALQVSEVDPGTIDYIEAHATGTPLGDPIEIKALTRGLNRTSTGRCIIGAVKTNIGHLDTASGAAGFIKTVLCLKHRMIPPTLHFTAPNPELGLEHTPFHINTQLLPWERTGNQPLRAGVNSFGIGGVNAFVVLEEWRGPGPDTATARARQEQSPQLIVLSAKTGAALDKMSRNLADYLKKNPEVNLGDVAYTLQVGRKAFAQRRFVVCSTTAEAIEALDAADTSLPGDLEEPGTLHHTGRMWLQHQDIDWRELHNDRQRYLVPLPTYPFERKRYWLDENLSRVSAVLKKTLKSLKDGEPVDPAAEAGALKPAANEPIHPRPELETPYAAPAGQTQENLARTWQEFFGLEQVGIDDDFFLLGGDSLKATALLSRIHKTLNIKIPLAELFAHPTIRELSRHIDGAASEDFVAVEPAEEKEYYRLTPAQQRFYMIQQLTPGSTAFNMPGLIPQGREVDKEKLEQTFKRLIQRHESLRTSFIEIDSTPMQRIHRQVEFHIGRYDGQGRSLQDIRREFINPFDLAQAPLVRAALAAVDQGQQILLVDMHHIISDGTSHQVLNRDFMSLYNGEDLSPLRLRYRDFSQWLNRAIDSGAMKKHEEYWLKRMQGRIPVLEPPTDYPRPRFRSVEGAHYTVSTGTGLAAAVKDLGRQTGATLYMVLLAAFTTQLYRYTGQQDILVGAAVAGRYHADLENVIGLVIGGLAMRNFPMPHKTFREFLAEIKTDTLEAYEHQAYPLEELIKKLNREERPGHDHIIDVSLILQNMYDGAAKEAGSSAQPQAGVHVPAASKLDITIYAMERGGDISLMFEYCTALFKPRTIERMAAHLVTILKQAAGDPDVTLSALDMTGDEEKNEVIGGTPTCYPLSHPEKRIYYTEKTFPGATCNNAPFTVRYGEILDKELLEQAINIVLRRNETLRLRIVEFDPQREPVQYIAPYSPYKLTEIDFTREDRDPASWAAEETAKPMPMMDSPLYYFIYLKFSEKESGFYMKLHHIITDGWSVILALDEITAVYRALHAGEPVSESPNPSYIDYLPDEREYLRSPRAQEDRAFWHRYLLPLPEKLRLTGRGNDTPGKQPVTRGKTLELPDELRTLIHRYCKEHKTTIFKVVLSALAVYLSRINGVDDAAVGTTNHNRCTDHHWKIPGMFVSTFPIRVKTGPGTIFSHLVERTGRELNDILKNRQRYPFDLLLEELRQETGVDPVYLLDVDLVGHPDFEEACYSFQRHFAHHDPAPLTIHINLSNRDMHGVLELQYHYQVHRFDADAIDRLHSSLTAVLDDALKHPGKRLQEIELLSANDKETILHRFNETAPCTHYPLDKAAHQIIEETAVKMPDRIALSSGEYQLTYRQLNRQAGHLAAQLREKGIRPGDIAALKAPPSLEMITGILGILKSGGAYLPIDPEYPQERIAYMLKDSGAKITLTNKDIDIKNPSCSPSCPSWLNHHSSNLAYVIYTSGTTGRPKGVAVEHGNLTAYLAAFSAEFHLEPRDIVVQQASFAFDAFVEELYPILQKGGRLALPRREEVKDADLLTGFIQKHHVTMITCSPLLLNELNSRGISETMRIFISGGDRLKAAYVENLVKSGAAVYNTYGPTEAAVCASYYRCGPGSPPDVPIGGPISRYKLYILDRHGRPLPVGIAGELCIGGPGVTRGYLNRPQLTADKFLQSSNKSYKSYRTYIKGTIYKTGDLACWLPDGSVDFLGRIDQQVKIRGYRIEPGEIQTLLQESELVNEAVVVPVEEGQNLCAYIAPRAAAQTGNDWISQLRTHLESQLPNYMVPAYIVPLQRIPTTASGKIDYPALPAPRGMTAGTYVPPRDDIEQRLVDIWRQVLDREPAKTRIGIDDNFFNLGGHSLRATVMISRIHRELEVRVSLADCFENPTVRQLARHIKQLAHDRFIAVHPLEQKSYYELSYSQRRLWFIDRMEPGSAFYHINQWVNLTGGEVETAVRTVLQRLLERHEGFRTCFVEIDDRPVQWIKEPGDVEIPLKTADISGLEQAERERKTGEIMRREQTAPFDLSAAPLFRAFLVKEAQENYILFFTLHHIITDGWSMEILKREFMRLYQDERSGRVSEPPPLPVQYRDFAAWQNNRLQDPRFRGRGLDYWRKQLAGGAPILKLPVDYEEAENDERMDSAAFRFTVHGGVFETLRALTAGNRASLFALLMAALQMVMAKLTGQEVILMGVVSAGRQNVSLHDTVGIFVNTLIHKQRIDLEQNFADFLRQVNRDLLEMLEYQDYPLELVFEDLKIPYPRLSAMFNMLNLENTAGQRELQDTSSYHMDNVQDAKFDMEIYALQLKNGLEMRCHYRKKLFKKQTVEYIINQYLQVLTGIAANPGQPLKNYIFKKKKKRLKL